VSVCRGVGELGGRGSAIVPRILTSLAFHGPVDTGSATRIRGRENIWHRECSPQWFCPVGNCFEGHPPFGGVSESLCRNSKGRAATHCVGCSHDHCVCEVEYVSSPCGIERSEGLQGEKVGDD